MSPIFHKGKKEEALTPQTVAVQPVVSLHLFYQHMTLKKSRNPSIYKGFGILLFG